MKKKLLTLLTFAMLTFVLFSVKIDSHAAKKNFRAFAVTDGFLGEESDFTGKYKNGVFTLNGTMEYLKKGKGYKLTGKKVKFKKKRFRVSKKCTYQRAAGTRVSKKSYLIKYFKKYKIKELFGWATIEVRNNKIVSVYESD